jgi:hypothetical protein
MGQKQSGKKLRRATSVRVASVAKAGKRAGVPHAHPNAGLECGTKFPFPQHLDIEGPGTASLRQQKWKGYAAACAKARRVGA